MDASKTQKLERCIRLTESNNDHEALNALRIAQNICKTNGLNFSDYLLKNKGSHTNSAEVQSLRNEIAHLNSKYYRLNAEHAALYLAHRNLQIEYEKKKKTKKKASSVKDASAQLQSLKKMYRELKEDYDDLEEQQEYYLNRSKIIDDMFEGNEEEREDALIRLVKDFIKQKYIIVSESKWVSSTSLYKLFLEDACFDIPVMSNKKFSQTFSAILKIKPITGGEFKNLMGFSVSMSGRI